MIWVELRVAGAADSAVPGESREAAQRRRGEPPVLEARLRSQRTLGSKPIRSRPVRRVVHGILLDEIAVDLQALEQPDQVIHRLPAQLPDPAAPRQSVVA